MKKFLQTGFNSFVDISGLCGVIYYESPRLSELFTVIYNAGLSFSLSIYLPVITLIISLVAPVKIAKVTVAIMGVFLVLANLNVTVKAYKNDISEKRTEIKSLETSAQENRNKLLNVKSGSTCIPPKDSDLYGEYRKCISTNKIQAETSNKIASLFIGTVQAKETEAKQVKESSLDYYNIGIHGIVGALTSILLVIVSYILCNRLKERFKHVPVEGRIKSDYLNSQKSIRELAKKYGKGKSTIQRIVTQ